MAAVVRFALAQRGIVLVLTVLLVGVGVWSFQRLPIDAVPDITNVQVQINTEVKGLAPAEIESLVTFPIETSMGGIPGVESVRSLTRYGLSQVTVVFRDGTDVYFARQLVLERLQEAKEQLPAGVGEPTMGPISTGLGEIFLYTVEGEGRSPIELRTIQDWLIKPQLRTVPGVAEVNSIGGFRKEYHVLVDPLRLASYGLSFHEVLSALETNNANTGGGYIEHKGEQYVVRGVGLAQSTADLESIVLSTGHGVPVYVRDVAEVTLGEELRSGAATERGREVVLGTAMMLMGENSRTVSMRVREKLVAIQATLPKGVLVRPVYDRTDLVNETLETVRANLTEGALFVVAVLLVLLGNMRAALIVASAIPLSMLFAVTGMLPARISGNLMSLGAIDFGLIVDGAVVMVEHIVSRLAEEQRRRGRLLSTEEHRHAIAVAALEAARPVTFTLAIIMIVYLPLLTLQGIEGKMFQPMGATVLLALAGALVLTLTLVPVLCTFLLRGKLSVRPNRTMALMSRLYDPALRAALAYRFATVAVAVSTVALGLWLFPRLGSEFVPRLDEGALAIGIARLPSVSLTQAVEMEAAVESALLQVPEVENVFARIGTSEVATDPMGPDRTDLYVMLKPRAEWSSGRDKADLIATLQHRLERLPGQFYEFSQPIELRFNELIAGVRADVAVKVFGDDLGVMKQVARRVGALLRSTPGAEDVRVESVSGQPELQIEVDRQAISRLGLDVADVLELVEVAVGGKAAGQILEADRRSDIIVRLPPELRRKLDDLGDLTVKSPVGALIPLAQIAHIQPVFGLAAINREHGKRRLAVQCNVRGRDLGSFVADVEARIDREVRPSLPAGYYIEYGGQYENLQAARRRLAFVVPLALGLIFFLLFSAFRNVRQSLLVFSGVPLAMTGGVVALSLRGLPFSISAGVGFIALSGVAVLSGIVMVTHFNRLREEGSSLEEAVTQGSLSRLRPLLMASLVAALGYVPMAVATGTGAEVQRPLATVVVGGLICSTLLTLVVVPVLYRWIEREVAPDQASERR